MINRNYEYVDTIIGTIGDLQDQSAHGGGKTYPGAVRPFGMVQFSPDTITEGDNGSGYSYHHTTIEGFSINHLSGIGWYGDLGNFQVMPTTGELCLVSGTNKHALTQIEDRGYESDFDHATEITQAGYYAVKLSTYNVYTELTSTDHVGFMRMTYDASDLRRVQINLARRIAGRAKWQVLKINPDYSIEGCIQCTSDLGGFGHGDGNVNYNLHYIAKFDSPWIKASCYNKNAAMEESVYYEGEELCFFAEFSPSEKPVLLKIGISYINAEGASENLEAEIPHWDFDRVVAESADAWDNALNVNVSGSDEERKTIFYTTLYHTLLDPRMYSDVNGNYLSADNSVRTSHDFEKRTVFSGWDVFRSEFPLLTIIRPSIVNDMINSLIDIAEHENISFPRWELLGHETGCMLGDPGIIVTVDAYRKGIRNFDVNKAYEICLKTLFDENSKRQGRENMNTLGYVDGLISATLENTFADWAVYMFATELGDNKHAEQLKDRPQNYRNIYDKSVGWMRRKDSEGNWYEWKNEYDEEGCVESNIFQQTWFVPHDVQGLIELFGKERFILELERFMSEADLSLMWNDAYNHPNEPCHHLVHMFTEAGLPWRTQYWVRRIQNESYKTGPFGYCGNEDVGQMSAWYTLTAMGMHMIAPGSNIYYLNTPLFKKIQMNLSEKYHTRTISDQFVIETDCDPEENMYIQSLSLNGKAINRAWITFDEISAGGVLSFKLGKEENHNWGLDLPESLK